MKQIIPPPEIEKDYSLHISSVYKMKNRLIMISELKKLDGAVTPEKAGNIEVEVNQELPVTHYVIVDRGDINHLAKEKGIESFDEIKGQVKHADLVYGEELRSYKDRLMSTVHRWKPPEFSASQRLLGAGAFVFAVGAWGFFANSGCGKNVETMTETLDRTANNP